MSRRSLQALVAAAALAAKRAVKARASKDPKIHNPARSTTKRDAGLAKIAKEKTLGPINEWPWHINERIERVEPRDIELYGDEESVVLIWTTSENSFGARKNGRLLIASNESAGYIGAGAFWIEEYGMVANVFSRSGSSRNTDRARGTFEPGWLRA